MERRHRVDEQLDRDHDDFEDDLEDDELGAVGRRALTDALRGPAEPLPQELRLRLERATGRDLAGVRIRTGDAAARAARVVGARAFAIGRDLVFGAGVYRPGDPDGIHLVAHEVAHAVQQDLAAPRPSGPLARSRRGDPGEREAHGFADAFARGTQVPLSPAGGAGALVQGEWHEGQRLPTQETEGSEELGTEEHQSIRMYRFGANGSPGRPVLLVGGMHGNERAALQVVDILLDRLQEMERSGRHPPQDIYVIPMLHPGRAAANRRLMTQRQAGLPPAQPPDRRLTPQEVDRRDPNRDYPDEGWARSGRDGRPRYAGSQILVRVIERIQAESGGRPPRIVQVHGTENHAPGISRDIQNVPTNVRQSNRASYERQAAAGNAEDERDVHGMTREMERLGHGNSVRGPDQWPEDTDNSLGRWGSAAVDDGATQRPALSVITVETDGNQNSVDRRDGDETPEGRRNNDEARGEREAELMALADVIEQFLLGTQDRPNRSQENQRGP